MAHDGLLGLLLFLTSYSIGWNEPEISLNDPTTVYLSWDEAPSNDHSQGTIKYFVIRNNIEIGTTLNHREFEDSTVEYGKSYEYIVRCIVDGSDIQTRVAVVNIPEGQPQDIPRPGVVTGNSWMTVDVLESPEPQGMISLVKVFVDNTVRHVSPSVGNYRITGLLPHTIYEIYVDLCTTSMCGRSPTVVVQTLEDSPQGLEAPKVVPISSSAMTISWLYPSKPNGIISQFSIFRGRADDPARSFVRFTRLAKPPFGSWPDTLRVTDRLLEPFTTYNYIVKATNGFATTSSPVGSGKTFGSEPEGLQVPDVKPSESMIGGLDIVWTRPLSPNGIIQNYIVFVNLVEGLIDFAYIEANNITRKQWTATITRSRNGLHLLKPSTKYSVAIKATNSYGSAVSSFGLGLTSEATPEPLTRSPDLRATGPKNVDISWDYQDTTMNGILINGHITCTSVDDYDYDQKQTIVGAPFIHGNVSLSNLGPSCTYECSVTLCNSFNCTTSPSASKKTLPQPPTSPNRPNLAVLGANTISIQFASPKQPLCLSLTNIQILRNNLVIYDKTLETPEAVQDEFTDSTVQPNTFYDYSVKLYSEHGQVVSPVATAKTQEGTPEGLSSPIVTVVDSESISVDWKAPTQPHGIMTKYMVIIYVVGSALSPYEFCEGIALGCTITGFEAATTLNVQVKGCNKDACALSDVTIVTTLDGIPQGIIAPKLSQSLPTMLHLDWEAPIQQNGDITYQLWVQGIVYSKNDITTFPTLPISSTTTTVTTTTTTSTGIIDLLDPAIHLDDSSAISAGFEYIFRGDENIQIQCCLPKVGSSFAIALEFSVLSKTHNEGQYLLTKTDDLGLHYFSIYLVPQSTPTVFFFYRYGRNEIGRVPFSLPSGTLDEPLVSHKLMLRIISNGDVAVAQFEFDNLSVQSVTLDGLVEDCDKNSPSCLTVVGSRPKTSLLESGAFFVGIMQIACILTQNAATSPFPNIRDIVAARVQTISSSSVSTTASVDLDSPDSVPKPFVLVYEGVDRTFDLRVKPFSSYGVFLVAFTSAGSGKPSKIVNILTLQDSPGDILPPNVSDVFAMEANINWQGPTDSVKAPNGILRNFSVVFYESRDVGSILWTGKPSAGSFRVKNLLPFTDYSVTLQAATDGGIGSSPLSRFTTLEAKPEGLEAPFVSSISPYTVTLSWKEPLFPNGIPQKYILKRDDSTEYIGPLTKFIVDNLKPNRMYTFSLTFCNRVSCVDANENAIAVTPPTVPVSITPTLRVVGPRQIFVYWSEIYDSGVVTYTLDRSQLIPESNETVNLLSDSDKTSFSDVGLLPGTRYKYIITAKNAQGKTKGSPVTSSTPPEVPLGPSPLESQVLSATSVRFSWKVPSETYGSSISYYIKIQKLAWSYSNNSLLSEDTPICNVTTTFCVYEELFPSTLYIFQLFSCNSAGCIPTPTTNSVITPEAPPKEVYVLEAIGIRPNRIQVKWDLHVQTNGKIEHFIVMVTAQGNDDEVVAQALVDEGRTAVVGSRDVLKPYTFYEVVVAACTLAGCTNSSSVDVLTVETAPEGISSLLIETSTTKPIAYISWDALQSPNGKLLGYAIVYLKVKGPGPEHNGEVSVEPSVIEIELQLHGGSEYEIYLKAWNSASNTTGSPVYIKTVPSIPSNIPEPVPISIAETEITFDLKDPIYPNGVITSRTLIQNPGAVKRTTLSAPGHFKVTNLVAGVLYQFKFEVCNVMGCDSSSVFEIITSPEGIPAGVHAPTLEPLSSEAVEVAWTKPSLPHGLIISYEVIDINSNTVLTRDVTTGKATLSGYEPYSEISCILRACTLTGCNVSNDVAKVYTLEAPPEQFNFVDAVPLLGGTSVSLSWKMPLKPNGIVWFETWVFYPTRLFVSKSTDLEVTVSGLRPLVNYVFEIKCCNGAGCSPEIFANTNTTEGAPNKVDGPVLKATSATSVLASWKAPSEPNGVILGYRLFRGISNKFIVYQGTLTQFTDVNLSPATKYAYSVSAFTAGGETYSESTNVTTPEGSPSGLSLPKCTAKGPRKVEVMWLYPTEPRGTLISATLNWDPVDLDHNTNNNISIPAEKTSWEIDDLVPNTNYIFHYTLCIRSGCTVSDPCTTKTDADAPHGVEPGIASPLGPEDILVRWDLKVTWKEPKTWNGIPKNFTIQYRRDDSDVNTGFQILCVTEPTTFTCYKNDLPSYTKVEFILVACSDGGCTSSKVFFGISAPSAPIGVYKPTEIHHGSSSSVQLVWQQPQIPNGDPIFYEILYKLYSDELQNGSVKVGPALTGNITGLVAATKYYVAIKAINAGGSTIGPSITIITRDEVPKGLAPPAVEAVSSTSIKVEWSFPAQSNGNIMNFSITGTRLIDQHPFMAYTGLDRSVEVLNLIPYTQYKFTVTACTITGCGTSALSKAVLTFGAPPEYCQCMTGQIFVLHPTFSGIESNQVTIKWTIPVRTNGQLNGYSIQRATVSREWKNIDQSLFPTAFSNESFSPTTVANVGSTTLSFTDRSVQAFSAYLYRVFAINQFGQGVSFAALVETKEGPPFQVETPNVEPISSTSMVISWKPPKLMNGILMKYEIQWQRVGASSGFVTGYSGKDLSWNQTELSPHTEYEYYLICTTGGGSTSSKSVVVRTCSSTPDEVFAVSAQPNGQSSVIVTWSVPIDLRGTLVEYKVVINDRTVPSTETSSIIDGLEAFTEYNVQVQACVSGVCGFVNCGKFSESILVRTGPGEIRGFPAPYAESRILGKVQLTWQAPIYPQGIMTSYEPQRLFGSDFETLALLDGKSRSFTDKNLTEGTEYTYRIIASNGVYKKASPVVVVSTPHKAPTGFRPIQILQVRDIIAIVMWYTPINSNGKILEQFVLVGDSRRIPVPSYVSSGRLLIPNLKPYTSYNLIFESCLLYGCAQSQPVKITTACQIPESPIIEQISASSTSISFELMPAQHKNCHPEFYTAQLFEGNPSYSQNALKNGSIFQVALGNNTISGLIPATSYSFQCSATNKEGSSTTEWFKVDTAGAKPKGVGTPEIEPQTLVNTVFVKWREPEYPYGIVEKYILYDGTSVLYEGQESFFIIRNLEPATVLELRIVACNRKGCTGGGINTYTYNIPPYKAKNVGVTNVGLTEATVTASLEVLNVRYTMVRLLLAKCIKARQSDTSNCRTLKEILPDSTSGAQISWLLDNLDIDTKYSIIIVTQNELGDAYTEPITFVTARPPMIIGTPTCIAIRPNQDTRSQPNTAEILCEWDSVFDEAVVIKSYKIKVEDNENAPIIQDYPSTEQKTVIAGLEWESVYVITISAIGEHASSDASLVVIQTAPPFIPSPTIKAKTSTVAVQQASQGDDESLNAAGVGVAATFGIILMAGAVIIISQTRSRHHQEEKPLAFWKVEGDAVEMTPFVTEALPIDDEVFEGFGDEGEDDYLEVKASADPIISSPVSKRDDLDILRYVAKRVPLKPRVVHMRQPLPRCNVCEEVLCRCPPTPPPLPPEVLIRYWYLPPPQFKDEAEIVEPKIPPPLGSKDYEYISAPKYEHSESDLVWEVPIQTAIQSLAYKSAPNFTLEILDESEVRQQMLYEEISKKTVKQLIAILLKETNVELLSLAARILRQNLEKPAKSTILDQAIMNKAPTALVSTIISQSLTKENLNLQADIAASLTILAAHRPELVLTEASIQQVVMKLGESFSNHLHEAALHIASRLLDADIIKGMTEFGTSFINQDSLSWIIQGVLRDSHVVTKYAIECILKLFKYSHDENSTSQLLQCVDTVHKRYMLLKASLVDQDIKSIFMQLFTAFAQAPENDEVKILLEIKFMESAIELLYFDPKDSVGEDIALNTLKFLLEITRKYPKASEVMLQCQVVTNLHRTIDSRSKDIRLMTARVLEAMVSTSDEEITRVIAGSGLLAKQHDDLTTREAGKLVLNDVGIAAALTHAAFIYNSSPARCDDHLSKCEWSVSPLSVALNRDVEIPAREAIVLLQGIRSVMEAGIRSAKSLALPSRGGGLRNPHAHKILAENGGERLAKLKNHSDSMVVSIVQDLLSDHFPGVCMTAAELKKKLKSMSLAELVDFADLDSPLVLEDYNDPKKLERVLDCMCEIFTGDNGINSVQDAVDLGLVQRFLEVAYFRRVPDLQLKGIQALSAAITANPEASTKSIQYQDTLLKLVTLLKQNDESFLEQVLVILISVASSNTNVRDKILETSVFEYLSEIAAPARPEHINVKIAELIMVLCDPHVRSPQFRNIKKAVVPLLILASMSNTSVVEFSVQGIKNLCANEFCETAFILGDTALIQKIIQLTRYPEISVVLPALDVLANLLSTEHKLSESILDIAATKRLVQDLSSPVIDVQCKIGLCLANVTAGTIKQVRMALDAGAVKQATTIILGATDDQLKTELAWVISNAINAASDRECQRLVASDIVRSLVVVGLDANDVELRLAIFDALLKLVRLVIPDTGGVPLDLHYIQAKDEDISLFTGPDINALVVNAVSIGNVSVVAKGKRLQESLGKINLIRTKYKLASLFDKCEVPAGGKPLKWRLPSPLDPNEFPIEIHFFSDFVLAIGMNNIFKIIDDDKSDQHTVESLWEIVENKEKRPILLSDMLALCLDPPKIGEKVHVTDEQSGNEMQNTEREEAQDRDAIANSGYNKHDKNLESEHDSDGYEMPVVSALPVESLDPAASKTDVSQGNDVAVEENIVASRTSSQSFASDGINKIPSEVSNNKDVDASGLTVDPSSARDDSDIEQKQDTVASETIVEPSENDDLYEIPALATDVDDSKATESVHEKSTVDMIPEDDTVAATNSNDEAAGVDKSITMELCQDEGQKDGGLQNDNAQSSTPKSKIIRINHNKQSLGMKIKRREDGMWLIHPKKDSLAESAGIEYGMFLLSVNDQSISDMSKMDIIRIIQESSEIALEVQYPSDVDDRLDSHLVLEAKAEHSSETQNSTIVQSNSAFDIHLKIGDEGLGIELIGPVDPRKANEGVGTYITDILPGGAASSSGLLQSGMRLLKVNGISVNRKVKKEVYDILKAAVTYAPKEPDGTIHMRLRVRPENDLYLTKYNPDTIVKSSRQ